ncbi:MAG TPA: universal stress protein [Spirochaetota bacterium]|nr:universal stress protein [Spirochaetota bacterium]
MDSPIEKIMVYIDGTEQSITAAQYALCLTRVTGAQLIALYVIDTKALDDLLKARIFLKEEQMEYERDLEDDSKRYLNHVRELAQQKGMRVETKSVMGSVYREIVREVKEEGIDLLIIGELSRIKSRRDEFYDQTERAMRAVRCSVLIVKNEDRVWELYESL